MQAVLFVGIQATGKTTFYTQRFLKTHVRISLDLLRTRHREAAFLQTCLQTQQPFVVDNTNPTAIDRQRYIVPAKAAGYSVIGYYLASGIRAAIERNSRRPEAEQVPVKGILSAYGRLEVPALAEGFDELYYVRPLDNGQFAVEEWQDEV
jgi:predicted kinase